MPAVRVVTQATGIMYPMDIRDMSIAEVEHMIDIPPVPAGLSERDRRFHISRAIIIGIFGRDPGGRHAGWHESPKNGTVSCNGRGIPYPDHWCGEIVLSAVIARDDWDAIDAAVAS